MDVEGKRVSEVIPGIFEVDHNLFDVYGNVAATGQAEVFDTFVKSLDQWMRIAVYSPQKGYFIAVFDDITERTHQQEALVVANRKLNMLSDITRHDTLNNLTALQGYLLSVDKNSMQSSERLRWEKMLKLVKLIDSQIGFTREYKDMGASPPRWLDAQQVCEEAIAISRRCGHPL